MLSHPCFLDLSSGEGALLKAWQVQNQTLEWAVLSGQATRVPP